MIEPKDISACLITKDPVYPKEIIRHVSGFPFGEILVLTNCDSPHRKQELFRKAKHDFLYYQDDDCLAPIDKLLPMTDFPDRIVCAMKSTHIAQYANKRHALIGWGAIFPKSVIHVLDWYLDVYGEDHIYRRETERIMTYFNFPQVRLDLPIVDLPSAMAEDRLWRQSEHWRNIEIVEERCRRIEEKILRTV
jgi:hypothetical protein